MREREREGRVWLGGINPELLEAKPCPDPVSNSPLLAVLMPATTSYHTICSGDCPALLPHIQ